MKLTTDQMRELLEAACATGNRLAKAIELADLTQAELAEATGLAQPYISAVARGRHATITVKNAYKFCAHFGCDIEDLFPCKS